MYSRLGAGSSTNLHQGHVLGFHHFRAYVDDQPVALAAATCDGSGPQATCTSPFPPLTDGMHTISLVAVSRSSGFESERSARLTVLKVSSTGMPGGAVLSGVGAASFPGPDTVVATSDGLAFAVDIVARGVAAPAQLAWDPDGRLLVAEADGQLRVFRPGGLRDDVAAHDTRALLDSSRLGPPGLVLHPIAFHWHPSTDLCGSSSEAMPDGRAPAQRRARRLRRYQG